MTEAQGGGRRGAATVDHLKYINTYIQEKKRCIYNIPGCNAYDKAWMKAIIYSLNKNGIKGKLLRTVNSQNTEQIRHHKEN